MAKRAASKNKTKSKGVTKKITKAKKAPKPKTPSPPAASAPPAPVKGGKKSVGKSKPKKVAKKGGRRKK